MYFLGEKVQILCVISSKIVELEEKDKYALIILITIYVFENTLRNNFSIDYNTIFSYLYANISTFNIRLFFPKFSRDIFVFSVHVQNGKKGRFYFCHLITISGAWKSTQNCLQRPPLGPQKGQLPLFIGYL